MRSASLFVAGVLCSLAVSTGCGDSAEDPNVFGSGSGDDAGADAGPGSSFETEEGGVGVDEEGGTGSVDPRTCAEAAAAKSYVGCDFWPTISPNAVRSVFDFAVVVANTGTTEASVTVTGPLATNQTVKVAPNSLSKIYLPWVQNLKGPEVGSWTPSVIERGGAFHLVSSIPVSVYQFSALEFSSKGGPPGKDWGACLTNPQPCYAYSNDASLLLPTAALTGNYRVAGYGQKIPDFVSGGMLTVTGTVDNTHVNVRLGDGAGTVPGGTDFSITPASHVISFVVNKGDVATVNSHGSLGGSQVTADHPVQAIAANRCEYTTDGSCDHLEESLVPAETLGKHYAVATATGPSGKAIGQVVEFYGNVDGTTLTYVPGRPPGCPTTLNAGQSVICATGSGTAKDQDVVAVNFEVFGDHEFAIATLLQGQGAAGGGDPSQSSAVAVEQFRKKYVFLAPDDYDANYADVVAPPGTNLVLDGSPVTIAADTVSANFGVIRIKLGTGNNGAHVIEGDNAFGIQVLGYGLFTSYQYPGGMNLGLIAPPPPPVVIN